MSKSETEVLLEEIHENVRRDRRRLEDICDAIQKLDALANDPLAKAAMAENMARLVDGLTRSNSQLVELAKVKIRKEMASAGADGFNGMSPRELEEVFNDIGEGFSSGEQTSGEAS